MEYCLTLRGTNAITKGTFSTVNKIWTAEKRQLSIDTLKAMLIVNVNEKCEDFYERIKDSEFVKSIHQSAKYSYSI